MNTLIKVEVNVVTKETKGLEILQQTCLKTKTNLEVKLTEKDVAFQEMVAQDIEMLELEGEKVSSFLITTEGAKALGRIINRSIPAFIKLGIEINDLDWDASAGVVEVKGLLTTQDVPYLVETMLRLTQRATKAISYTHHPLTLFDLKQIIGLVYDLKQEVEGVKDLADWFDIRELTILEGIKEAKAIAKENAKALTKEKAKKKRREKNPKTGPNKAKTVANGKINGKAKEKNLPKSAKKSAKLNLV